MSSNEMVSGVMDFYAGERQRQDRGLEPVSPLRAWVVILLTVAICTSILYGIGRLFFWNKFNADPFYEQQYQLLKQRVAAEPENLENLVSLGWVYFQKGDLNQALVYFDRASSLDEKYFPAMFNKGLTHLETEKYSLAVNAFQNAAELAPRDHVTHMNLGLAYAGNGEYAKAIDSLETAYALRPGTVEILLILGDIYETTGQVEGAIEVYNQVLAFDPNNQTAAAALKRVAGN